MAGVDSVINVKRFSRREVRNYSDFGELEVCCAEGDMTIDDDVKVELLSDFHKKIYDPMFLFPCKFGVSSESFGWRHCLSFCLK